MAQFLVEAVLRLCCAKEGEYEDKGLLVREEAGILRLVSKDCVWRKKKEILKKKIVPERRPKKSTETGFEPARPKPSDIYC